MKLNILLVLLLLYSCKSGSNANNGKGYNEGAYFGDFYYDGDNDDDYDHHHHHHDDDYDHHHDDHYYHD